MKKNSILLCLIVMFFLFFPMIGCCIDKNYYSSERYVEKCYSVSEAANYISSLTEKGTYFVKVFDNDETSCSELKDALCKFNDIFGYNSGVICIDLDLYDTVLEINSWDFDGCTSLVSIVLPSGTDSIRNDAFWCCEGLVSIKIPSSVTSIGDSVFYYCTSLSSIIIPSKVTSIGSSAFDECISLKSITIPSSVTSIGGCAFSNCTSLSSVTILSDITSISRMMFIACTSLTSIMIPQTVTSIGERAFGICTSLSSITIPSNVTFIDEEAFTDCPLLASVIFEDPKGWTVKRGSETSIIEESELQNPATAAEYLTTAKYYAYYTWTKE